ncbi:MAG: mechanosensitive ion channel [Marinicaulis sp.]|nr:mechanosensitive ion channel [Marinicaulis sp.]
MGAGGVSVFDILWAVILGVFLLWAATFLSKFFKGRLNKTDNLTPSVRGLLGQLIQIGLIVGAIWLALSAARVNLTGLAVLTGAIGVGIGFGLQSIFQNFIAGIIILLEKTLKVGDFIDLESGITGEVKEINVRSTLVTTNDNVDILVPNSEFISGRVTNWTLREVNRRVHVSFGVAYGTDKELVKKAALEAADNVPHTLKGNKRREPQVWLVEFGDSSLNYELVVWLTDDAVRRPGAVNAAYNWEIETALAKYGIEIPFPQRDVHIIPPETAGDLG